MNISNEMSLVKQDIYKENVMKEGRQMELHINELEIENGFSHVSLDEVSFRDIDQEFVIFETDQSYNSVNKNDIYYCFIKPYEGMFFRLIGKADADEKTISVDESIAESVSQDVSYFDVPSKMISKVVENGDLISNQQIINIGIDLYEDQNLLDTRDVTWIDSQRVQGNPDCITMEYEGENIILQLKATEGDNLIAVKDGFEFIITKALGISRK